MVVERIILTPSAINLSGTTNPVIRCNFNFRDIGDALVDKEVVLSVYLIRAYLISALGQHEQEQFGDLGFSKDGVVLSDEDFFDDSKPPKLIGGRLLGPVTGKGTGVLATMQGFIRRADKRFGRPWFFTPTKKDEFTGDSDATVTVATPDLKGEHIPLVNLNFPPGDLQEDFGLIETFVKVPQAMGTVIAFRMALREPAGKLEKGLVIASSGNPNHCPAAPGNGGGVLLTGIRDPKSQSTIGADGGKRPVTAPSATTRSLDRDLTGLYEAEQIGKFDATQDPPMMVHIHQAGHALVAWFSPARGSLGTNQKPLPAGVPQTPGCLISLEGPDSAGGYDFQWFEGKRPKPDLKPWLNVSDPDDLNSSSVIEGGIHPGRLQIVGKFAPNDLTQTLDITFFDVPVRASGVAPPKPVTLRLRRVAVRARLPFYLLKDFQGLDPNDPQKKDLGAAMLAEQVEPIPQSFWTRIADKIQVGMGPIVDAQFNKANGVASTIIIRDACDAFLLDLLKDVAPGDRAEATQKLRAILAASDIPVHGTGDILAFNALEFLNSEVSEQMDDLRKNPANKAVSDKDLYENNVGKGFQTIGIGSGGKVVYTLKFKSKDAPLKGSVAAQFGLSAFMLTIKKEFVTTVKGPKGEEIEQRKPDSSTGWIGSEEKLFFGVYGEGGVAAGWDFANMKLKNGKPGAKPGTVEIVTFVDLPTVSSFDGASFLVTALKLGSLDTPVGGAKLIDSSFLQFHLPSSTVGLDAVVETNFDISSKFDKKTLKTAFDAARKETPDAKDFIPSASIISLTQGWGKIFLNPDKVAPPPPREQTPEEAKRQVRRSMPVSFDVDSAELIPIRRQEFETMLAMDRALYTAADGDLRTTGFASPEASKDHNLKLSQARAFTIMQAVQDAFGADLAVSNINRTVEGLGEDPSEEQPPKGDGLLDPEAGPPTGMSAGDFQAQVLQEQRTLWPRWRRVDLLVNGVVSVRVMGRGARSDGSN